MKALCTYNITQKGKLYIKGQIKLSTSNSFAHYTEPALLSLCIALCTSVLPETGEPGKRRAVHTYSGGDSDNQPVQNEAELTETSAP